MCSQVFPPTGSSKFAEIYFNIYLKPRQELETISKVWGKFNGCSNGLKIRMENTPFKLFFPLILHFYLLFYFCSSFSFFPERFILRNIIHSPLTEACRVWGVAFLVCIYRHYGYGSLNSRQFDSEQEKLVLHSVRLPLTF